MSDEALQHWPGNHLEEVELCPVCGGPKYKVLESGLADLMSNPVTGPWALKSCVECGVAYLSPRPDCDSIGDAYRHYYTHSSDKDDLVPGMVRTLKDYISGKYYKVASRSGDFFDYLVYFMVRLLPPVSSYLDAKSRHIFELQKVPGRLLDIGCGNGEFLRLASKFGWRTVGVDFDEHAVTESRTYALDVRVGGVEVIDSSEKFDFITLSHVIEHVYDPADLIRSCYERLNDGGVLWLETPNVESAGYAFYKSCWRGLEPPRHITLFSLAALKQMLLKSGFTSVVQKQHGLSGVYMGLASEKLLNRLNPCTTGVNCAARKIVMLLRIVSLELIQLLYRKKREYLTLVAIR